ncbi:hypothetical protein [Rhodopila sp.]|uniref:hypothetical protein n=1 Tax=Rhodopila sp. TaxID=2480087 RepID=UPI003D0E98B0
MPWHARAIRRPPRRELWRPQWAAKGLRVLSQRIRAIAEAGRLRTSEERGAAMMHACCVGLVLTLAAAGARKGGELSIATREAVLAAIALDAPAARFDRQAAAATLGRPPI